MRYSKPFEFFLPAGAEMMFEFLSSIHCSALPLMIFLSNLGCIQHGNFPDFDLEASRADVVEAKDKEDIPYNQN